MASDISRKLFNPKRHYRGVLMQQGRVQLDADWNEQLDLRQYRMHTETKDVIGKSGVPKAGNAFEVSSNDDASNVFITSGHIYVGGLLCELEGEEGAEIEISYFQQPYYLNPDDSCFSALLSPPSSPPLSPPASGNPQLLPGNYLVYIDAWQREVTYLDDPLIREVALNEADTTTRLQNAAIPHMTNIGIFRRFLLWDEKVINRFGTRLQWMESWQRLVICLIKFPTTVPRMYLTLLGMS